MKYFNPVFQQRLGVILKAIRKSRHIKAQTVTEALGMADQSNYVRIENAQVCDISFWRLLEICEVLGCSLFQICFLLGIDFLGRDRIKTWEQFYESLKQLEELDQEFLVELSDQFKNKE
jgi:DNA-binding Xre family transcriptional regulator